MAEKENKKEEVKKQEKAIKKVQGEAKKEKVDSKQKAEVKIEDKHKNLNVDKKVKEDKKVEKAEAKIEDKKVEKAEAKKEDKKVEKPEAKKEDKKVEKPEAKKEKNNTNKKSKVPAIITVVMVLAIVAVLTVLIVTSTDPKKTVDGFLTNLKAGDFAKALEFAVGDTILENQKYSEDTQKLFFDKMSWKVKKVTTENEKAKVELEITNKDFSSIVQNCMKKLLTNFRAVLEGNVSEQSVERYFVEELKSDNVQMKTETKSIELEKQDGKWKVVENEELTKALLPGFEETVNALPLQ